MAKTTDELIVKIRAETRDLKRGLADVKNKLNSTFPAGQKSPVNRMGGQLKGLLAPLAAVGAAMASLGSIRGIAKTGDEFQALGITLDRIYGSREAGAKAFEDIKAFAETTPFQLETVTEAFIQLKSNGIEPAEDMLTIFGDAASAALNPLEAFNTLIRITQRAAGGGLGLEELEQLVNQGIPVYTILAEKIGKNRTELSELGKTAEGANIIMTALQDGLKEDFGGIMVERMDLLSTKTSNMEIAFKGLKDTLFNSGLGSWLKGLADSMTQFITGINEGLIVAKELKAEQRQQAAARSQASFFAQFPEFAPEGFFGNQGGGPTLEERFKAINAERDAGDTDPLGFARSGFNILQREIDRQKKPDFGFSAAFDATVPSVDSAVLVARQESLSRLNKILEDTITPAEELAEAFADLDLITASGELGADQLERIRTHLQGIEEEMALEIVEAEAKAAAEAVTLMEAEFSNLKGTIDGTITPIEQLEEEMRALQTVLNSGDAEVMAYLFGDRTPAEIHEILNRIGTELVDLKTETTEVADTFMETMAPAIASLAHAFTTDFVNSLMEGKDALGAFKDFAKNIVAQIIATFLQMAIVNNILNSIFQLHGTPNAFPTLPARAGGGSVNSRQPYLVGERGPELFVPHSGGVIRNNSNSGGGGGDQPIVVNQTINLSAGVVGTVRNEVQKMLPQIGEVAKAGVLEATRRGGSYRKGLLGS
jgi:tape measure domain-containing protein